MPACECDPGTGSREENALKIRDRATVPINQNRGAKPEAWLKVHNPLASANASAVL
jgi:hypothetical protein